MSDFDAYLETRRGECEATRRHLCFFCGAECTGDTTTAVDLDGVVGEFAICDVGGDNDPWC